MNMRHTLYDSRLVKTRMCYQAKSSESFEITFKISNSKGHLFPGDAYFRGCLMGSEKSFVENVGKCKNKWNIFPMFMLSYSITYKIHDPLPFNKDNLSFSFSLYFFHLKRKRHRCKVFPQSKTLKSLT